VAVGLVEPFVGAWSKVSALRGQAQSHKVTSGYSESLTDEDPAGLGAGTCLTFASKATKSDDHSWKLLLRGDDHKMDLYRQLAQPVGSRVSSGTSDEVPYPVSDQRRKIQTVITKVVETTDEGRDGLLLGMVAP
jgi:hypothetical protein